MTHTVPHVPNLGAAIRTAKTCGSGSRPILITSLRSPLETQMRDFTVLSSARKKCLEKSARKSECCVLLLKFSAIGVLIKATDVGSRS